MGIHSHFRPTLIVGAGVAGLAAARRLKELRLPFDVVDKGRRPGGLWNWDVPENGMYDSAHFISSKQRTAFPGFPMPDSYPDFPSHRQVAVYLQNFAAHFDLERHIEFGRTVIDISPNEGTGWQVTLDNDEIRRYRRVILATGHMWDPVWPDIPGRFSGTTLHAVSYKSNAIFDGRRVVVVGLGNSAADIAVDALHGGARSVTLSARSGSWIVPKYLLGRPADATGGKLTGRLPAFLRNRLNSRALRFLAPQPAKFGLPAPAHDFHQALPVVNSHLLYYIGHGRISPKPAIDCLADEHVVFADGSASGADLIVYATGYKISFPFIDPAHLHWQGGHPDFHLHVFHPEREDLFLIGIHEQISGGWSMHDAQARAIARLLAAPAAAGSVARGALPALHTQVRRQTEKTLVPKGHKYGILVDEKTYKRAVNAFINRLPLPKAAPQSTARPDQPAPVATPNVVQTGG